DAQRDGNLSDPRHAAQGPLGPDAPRRLPQEGARKLLAHGGEDAAAGTGGLVSRTTIVVIPAKAGIHNLCVGVSCSKVADMDSRLRGNDDLQRRGAAERMTLAPL